MSSEISHLSFLENAIEQSGDRLNLFGDRELLQGSLGGLLGKKGAPKEADDTFTSSARGIVVEVLSVGAVEGLNRGDKGIYLNRTPIRADDGTVIYKDVQWAFRRGTQGQLPLPDYADELTNERSVGTTVKKSTGIVTRTIINPELDVIRVRLQFTLFKVNNGVQEGTDIEFAIGTKEGTGAWKERLHKTIRAKLTSPAEIEYSFRVNNLGGTRDAFGVRIQVFSDDATDQRTKIRQLQWVSYQEVITDKINHSNLAVICHQFKADLFGSEPERIYDLNGKIVRIPSNSSVEDQGNLSFSRPERMGRYAQNSQLRLLRSCVAALLATDRYVGRAGAMD